MFVDSIDTAVHMYKNDILLVITQSQNFTFFDRLTPNL